MTRRTGIPRAVGAPRGGASANLAGCSGGRLLCLFCSECVRLAVGRVARFFAFSRGVLLPLLRPPSARSLARARAFAETLGDFEDVFSVANLEDAARACCRGVSWKRQVQSFSLNRTANCARLRGELLEGSYRPRPGKRFTVHERGKPREIAPCRFEDRVVQRVLCDRLLLPAVSRVAIHDNSACMPGKGTAFALARLAAHLEAHFARCGRAGRIVLFDFSKYFDSVRIDIALDQLAWLGFDGRTHALLRTILLGGAGEPGTTVAAGRRGARGVGEADGAHGACGLGGACGAGEADGASGVRGLGLGNQVSQLVAVYYPNQVDHWVKDDLER